MASPLLAVDNLTVERGGRVVLSGLDFTLAAGETILVAGRNGAGKSTLLRTLAGLLQPVAGHIRYALADEERRGVETIHYLGYEDALKSSLTVRENLDFWGVMLRCRHPGAPRANPEPVRFARADQAIKPMPDLLFASSGMPAEEALGDFGISRLIDLPAAYLSAGQKRRVALSRLLIAPRLIWLLDEPLIALDTAAQERTIEIMSAHTAAGGAILVASHQPLAATRRIELDWTEAA